MNRDPRKNLRLGVSFSIVAAAAVAVTIVARHERSDDTPQVATAQVGANELPAPPMTAASATSHVVSADALSLWKRTLSADRTIPAAVSVVETRFARSGAVRMVLRFDTIECEAAHPGLSARYRLNYAAPESLKNVVLVDDGHSVWRYDPRKRVVARQPAIVAPSPPELEEGVAGVPVQADSVRPEIEPDVERVAGRASEVLALRLPRSKRIVERRWVDLATGRTLRFEQYAGRDAHIVRRVEITGLKLIASPADHSWALAQIRPDFPVGASLLDAQSNHAPRLDEAEAAASRVSLPLHVRGFALRSVERTGASGALRATPATIDPLRNPHPIAKDVTTASPAASESVGGISDAQRTHDMTHLFYSKGNQAISVFVTADSQTSAAAGKVDKSAPALRAGPDWKPATLDGNRSGFIQQSRNGAAVAWVNPNIGYYIAVSRMPLSDLLPVAKAFAANRDDAPATERPATAVK